MLWQKIVIKNPAFAPSQTTNARNTFLFQRVLPAKKMINATFPRFHNEYKKLESNYGTNFPFPVIGYYKGQAKGGGVWRCLNL